MTATDFDFEEEQRKAEQQLKPRVTEEEIAFLFSTIYKEAENDKISIDQVFLGMCSAFTKLPMPHNINSKDAGAGKSYIIYDKNGNEVIGSGTFLQHGLDKDVVIKQIKNSEGQVVKLQLSNVTTDILTEEFTSDKLETLLNNSELDEHIQFSFTNNLGKSYGGFNAEEMIHLSSKELNARGQLGKAGEDLTVLYSDLTSKDKLYLQSQTLQASPK